MTTDNETFGFEDFRQAVRDVLHGDPFVARACAVAVRVVIGSGGRRNALAEEILALRLRPDLADPNRIPLPCSDTWHRLLAVAGPEEHTAWAQLVFAAISEGDSETAAQIEELARRRCAH